MKDHFYSSFYEGIKISKVMIVDDDRDIVFIFEEYLSLTGHTVIAKAYDGQKALDTLESLIGDNNSQDEYVILMDYRMPIMDGLEATKIIKEKYPRVNIIIITADFSIKQEAKKIGVRFFLEKPIRFTQLDDVLRTINVPLSIT